MIVLEHSFKTELVKDIESYLDEDARYILSMETCIGKHHDTSGQHYHFVGDMTDDQYDAFRQTIIKKKYKRQGVSKGDIARQYGKIGRIRDETKLMQYTVKDNNIIYKNIDLKTIQELISSSYKKEDRKFPFEKLMEYLKTNSNNYYDNEVDNGWIHESHVEFNKIEFDIIQFYLDNSKFEKTVTKSQIKSITTRYLMYYTPFKNVNHIYSYIMK